MSTQDFFTPGVVPKTNFNRNLGDLKMHTGPPSARGLATLWRGYSQVTGDSPIFRWNQQHFSYILVSVARFLPYFI